MINSLLGQTPKELNAFPEEFVGKSITFKNIWYWPILKEYAGYYTVQLDISNALDVSDRMELGFTTLCKSMGVVEKDIAKQMIKKEIGGYNQMYYGTVTGTMIKSNKILGTGYLFVLSKIINHHRNNFNSPINVFEKGK